MIHIDFATEANKQEIKQLVLSWLENDFQKKNQPSNHFWHNQSIIANAFDGYCGMVVRDEHQQFVAYMVWSFYSNKTGAEIDIVEVQESYRGQGIFKQMLSAFSNELPQVAVLSVSALEQAQPVFDKLGWQHAASSSSSWLRISEGVRFKHIKPAIPSSNTLPNGVAVAICSEDFYQVKTNLANYAGKILYLTPEIDSDYNLVQSIVATCHKDGYLGFYLDQKLIYECKPKHLTDTIDTHHAIVAFAQFPSNILTAFREHAASIEVSRDEQKAEEPARKMLRGENSARIKTLLHSQQVAIFSNPPEDLGDLPADEIHKAIINFCEHDQSYDGLSTLKTTKWFHYPLIFFLLESYQHEAYSSQDKDVLLACIKTVVDRYPNARKAVFNNQDIFSFAAYHSLYDVLQALEPLATELANVNLQSTAIDAALSVLNMEDKQSIDTLHYLLQALGNAVKSNFWERKFKEMFKNKYYMAQEEAPNNRHQHVQVMQHMLDSEIISLSEEFMTELTDITSPQVQALLNRGIWVRGIEDISGEVAILNKREELTDEELITARHSKEERSKANYTGYSPANFVCGDAQYCFYDSYMAGVVMDTGEGPFAYWQDGTGREMLSSEMDFTQEKLFNEEAFSRQFNEVSKSKILEHIQLLQSYYLQTHDQSPAANQIIDHRANLSLTIPIIFQPPQWNEGLLRYKKKHIIGVYVYPKKKQSVVNAAALRQALELTTLPSFALSEKNCSLMSVDLNQLVIEHGITQEMIDGALSPKKKHFSVSSSALYSDSSEEEVSDQDSVCSYGH